jgi:SNF2-related domain
MVSGTPLCSKIGDLHGELNFLQVWPFCLSNAQDGFWDANIGNPYSANEDSALVLLYALLDAVMMRHSKTQSYLDGRPLVVIPGRTIEWRSFTLDITSELYLFQYLESFAADALVRFLSESPGAVQGREIARLPHYALIRSLLGLISRCITNPKTITLKKLDHLRRILVGDRGNHQLQVPQHNPIMNGEDEYPDRPLVALMTAEQVLFEVQQAGQGANGGMNR